MISEPLANLYHAHMYAQKRYFKPRTYVAVKVGRLRWEVISTHSSAGIWHHGKYWRRSTAEREAARLQKINDQTRDRIDAYWREHSIGPIGDTGNSSGPHLHFERGQE